jgi:hypothetical protein
MFEKERKLAVAAIYIKRESRSYLGCSDETNTLNGNWRMPQRLLRGFWVK